MNALESACAELEKVVAGLDPAVLSGDLAARYVTVFAKVEKLGAAGRTLCAERVRVTRAWQGDGHKTCADWMASQAGSSVHDAAKVLETGRRLQDLPATADALRAGALSADQANVVVDAAAVDPAAERRLLGTARRETFRNLKTEGQRAKSAASDHEQKRRRIHSVRSCRHWIDDEGAGNLLVRGHASDTARVLEQLKPTQEAQFRANRSSGVRDTYENRQYDAFMAWATGTTPTASPGDAMSNRSSDPTGGSTGPWDPGSASTATEPTLFDTEPAAGSEPHSAQARCGHTDPPPANAESRAGPAGHHDGTSEGGGSGGGGGAPGGSGADPPTPAKASTPRIPGGHNTKIILLLSYDALLRGRLQPGDTCEIDGVGPIGLDDAVALWDGAMITAVARHGRDVTTAHLGRGLNAHQRTALESTRIRCTNIACNQTIAIQIDHRHPWAKRQVTELHNQDKLCPHDHELKTNHGWTLEPGTGRRRFLPPAQP